MATPPFWFKFEDTGQYATDSVSGLQAKMYDSTPGDRGVSFASGGFAGNCLSCDGSNAGASPAWQSDGALVLIPTSPPTSPPTTFTLACRFKTTVKQNKVLICFNEDGSGQPHIGNMALEFKTSAFNYSYVAFHFWYVLGGGDLIQTTTTTEMNYDNGNWHSALVVFNGSAGYLYVDDCNAPIGPNNNVPYNESGTFSWYIGGGADGNAITDGLFNGSIDDARYWDRALTQAEICTFMAGGDPDRPVSNALMFSCNT